MRREAISSRWSLLGSVLLHGLFIAVLLWAGLNKTQPVEQAPLALELWTSAPSAPPVVSVPAPVKAAPRAEPAPPPPVQPPAEVNLGKKEKTPPPEKLVQKPPEKKAEPAPKKPEPVKKEEKPAKPAEKAPAKPTPAPVVEKKPAKPVAQPPAAHAPGKGSKPAKAYSDDTNDLLASLDSTDTTHKATARSNQAGSANGVAGGSANGSSTAAAGWITRIQAKIHPLVQVPPNAKPTQEVQLRVTLLPTLEVQSVEMVKSSGNPAYDEAVKRAVMEARTFPSLPAGASFGGDYRKPLLKFRPG